MIRQQQPDGAWLTPLNDGLASIRTLVDETTLLPVMSQHYAPYGQPLDTQGSGTPYGFTGEQTDPNTLIYLRARYYNPELGVFPSLDPVLQGNRYAYVGSNPINRIDPTGLYDETPPTCGANNPQQQNQECVSFADFSSSHVYLSKIDTSLMDMYGVVLSVYCDERNLYPDQQPYLDAVFWTSTNKVNILLALLEIDQKIKSVSSLSFKQVFGGLEFRYGPREGESLAAAEAFAGGNSRGRRITWYPLSRQGVSRDDTLRHTRPTGPYGFNVSLDLGIRATIIHELGHVLDYRTDPEGTAGGLLAAQTSTLGIAYEVIVGVAEDDPAASDVGVGNVGYRENLDDRPNFRAVEGAADHFLNWVFDSHVNPSQGVLTFITEIPNWLNLASVDAQGNLQTLETTLMSIETMYGVDFS